MVKILLYVIFICGAGYKQKDTQCFYFFAKKKTFIYISVKSQTGRSFIYMQNKDKVWETVLAVKLHYLAWFYSNELILGGISTTGWDSVCTCRNRMTVAYSAQFIFFIFYIILTFVSCIGTALLLKFSYWRVKWNLFQDS